MFSPLNGPGGKTTAPAAAGQLPAARATASAAPRPTVIANPLPPRVFCAG